MVAGKSNNLGISSMEGYLSILLSSALNNTDGAASLVFILFSLYLK